MSYNNAIVIGGDASRFTSGGYFNTGIGHCCERTEYNRYNKLCCYSRDIDPDSTRLYVPDRFSDDVISNLTLSYPNKLEIISVPEGVKFACSTLSLKTAYRRRTCDFYGSEDKPRGISALSRIFGDISIEPICVNVKDGDLFDMLVMVCLTSLTITVDSLEYLVLDIVAYLIEIPISELSEVIYIGGIL